MTFKFQNEINYDDKHDDYQICWTLSNQSEC